MFSVRTLQTMFSHLENSLLDRFWGFSIRKRFYLQCGLIKYSKNGGYDKSASILRYIVLFIGKYRVFQY